MIHGYSNPKFYIYDSTGVTLQKTISLSSNILADKPIIDEVKISNTSPYTRTKLQEALGYYYRQTLTAGIGDYNSTLLQYQADQANDNKRNDIFKLQQVLTYCNAGYVIKYTPHADLEDLWGFSPLTVFVTLEDLGYTGTNKTDSISVTVEGTTLTSSAFLWYEFSFTELNGITNSNQCLSLNGTTQYGTCTQFDIGTTHSIEFWSKGVTYATVAPIISGTTGGESDLWIDGTIIGMKAQGSASITVNHGATLANLNHWIINRTEASVDFYLNNVKIGATKTITNNSFKVLNFGVYSTVYAGGKYRAARSYTTALNSTQRAIQYNSGNGNWPLDITANFIWEFDGTGGTSTTEDNQEGTATKDLTLTGTPSRTTW